MRSEGTLVGVDDEELMVVLETELTVVLDDEEVGPDEAETVELLVEITDEDVVEEEVVEVTWVVDFVWLRTA